MTAYDILGISSTANKAEIKKAFRKLSMVYHPDRPMGNEKKFVVIKDAYEKLMHPDTTKIHAQYEHRTEPDATITSSYLDKLGNAHISITFNNMSFAATDGILLGDYHWTLFGHNGGELTVTKKDLIKCDYKFVILFYPIIGTRVKYHIEFEDPRGKWEKFIDKLKTFI